jgi:hypothetical protein
MKRKVTKKHPDGSMEIVEEHDEAPAHHKNELDHKAQGAPPAKQYLDKIASQGHRGDTELAHVNPYEKKMLKMMGGVGTKNPHTGLRQYYLDPATGLENGKQDPSTSGTVSTDTGSFNLPLDVAPYSTSYSGLAPDTRTQLTDSVMPTLTSGVQNMAGNYDKYNQQALGSYSNMMNNALNKNIPLAINNMANRGIINSTEGQKVLSNVMSDAAISAGDKGYQTSMATALQKANIPTTLAPLVNAGSYNSSYQTDPTVMYRQMADLIKSMM